jgi:thiol:disulfide interchange protein
MIHVLSVAALLACLPSVPALAGGITWTRSYAVAQREAKRTGKLIMVDFYTDWCTFCKVLDRDVFTDPAVVAASRRFVNVKLNAEKEGLQSAKSLGVTSFPRLFFLKADGTVVSSIRGVMPPDELTVALRRLASYRGSKRP